MDLTMMERVGDRWKKMEGYCSTGQSPQQAAVPMEEEEEEEEEVICVISSFRLEVNENCTLQGYYAAISDSSLPTFRYNLSIPSSKGDWTDRLSRKVGNKLPLPLRNSPQEGSSLLKSSVVCE
jgi:hypothetical protein